MVPSTAGTSLVLACSCRPLRVLVIGLFALGAHSAAAPRPELGTAFLARGKSVKLMHETNSSARGGSKVKLDIYYESLCPQSLRTINGSLRQAWSHEDLRKRMALNLVPFGNAQVLQKSSISQGYQYWHPEELYPLIICQHGETECLGNKIHACAIALMKNPDKYVPFIICMASYGPSVGVEKTSYECAQKLGADMDSIKKCAYGSQGHTLVVANGEATMEPKLNKSYVPWIMINGVHDKTAEDGKLLQQLCGAMDSPKPGACGGSADALSEQKQDAKKPAGKKNKTKSCGDGTGKGGSGGGFF